MMSIKTCYFHIKGKPDNTTRDQNVTDNYIMADLDYVKGRGYAWSIRPIGQYTAGNDKYGYYLMNRLTVYVLKDNKEIYKEILVPCSRRSKTKEREAIELFDSNVVSAIIHRLGYDVDLEGVDI